MSIEQFITQIDQIVIGIKTSVLEELGCNESEIDPKAMNFVKIGRGCRRSGVKQLM
jgi:hypothetical protein